MELSKTGRQRKCYDQRFTLFENILKDLLSLGNGEHLFPFSQRLRLLKNAHLRRSPHPSSLQRTFKYVSFLRISGALHPGIFDQPVKNNFFQQARLLTQTIHTRDCVVI
jgi:hypothetical protein